MSTTKLQIIGGFPQADWNQTDKTKSDYIKNKPSLAVNEEGALLIEGGLASEGCIPYAKAGTAIGIDTTSGSKAFTIWGLGEGSTVDADEGIYLVDGITSADDDGNTYTMEVGDEYSCHVCYTKEDGTNGSRQRSFYGKITAIHETEQTAPNGDKLYAITVSPFFGAMNGTTFRAFLTNEDGTISDLEEEYIDEYGVDQERNTFRIPAKHLLGDRILGAYAYATGYQSTANTRGGFTAGRGNIADGNYGSALGYANKAAYAALGTGVGTKAIGIKSFTQGANTEAYQEAASAMGVRTKVDGFGAHGDGVDVTVNGRGAQGEGVSTLIDGQAAHGEGEGTVTIGNANHGEGKNTLAGMKWTKIESVDKGQEGTTTDPIYFDKTITTKLSTVSISGYVQPTGFSGDFIDYTLRINNIDIQTTADNCELWYNDGNEFSMLQSYEAQTIETTTDTWNVWMQFRDEGTSDEGASLGEQVYIYDITLPEIIEAIPPSIILTSEIEGFAEDDTYSILQTNFDTSYIDAGKITKIDGKTIYVDALPDFERYNGEDIKTENKISKVVRYFGVRTKPTIGTSTPTNSAHAENNGSDALANFTHSGGQNSIASGTGAFAHGQNAKALSRWTFATNSNTEANAAFAFAEGQDTVAQHQLSHVAGKGTKSKNKRQFVVGQYNDLTGGATELFTVGNGTSDTNRSNAFSVDVNGNAVVAGNVKATSFNGYTINKSVPSDAKFTDTTYSVATTSENGLMSAEDKTYIEKVKTNLDSHKVEIDVPADAKFTDTTYDVATNIQNGLMPKEFKSAIAIGDADKNFLNNATGIHAVALGRSNKALQKSAVATGINTIAYGFNSLTSGDKSIAFGNNSSAFGSGIQYKDTVTSDSKVAIQTAWESGTEYNAAIGVNSEVHGRGNLANADRTFVHGISNRANTANQFVTGKYNDYSSTATFIVGDGADKNNRSNAFEVFGKVPASETSPEIPAYAKVGGSKVITEDNVEDSVGTAISNQTAELSILALQSLIPEQALSSAINGITHGRDLSKSNEYIGEDWAEKIMEQYTATMTYYDYEQGGVNITISITNNSSMNVILDLLTWQTVDDGVGELQRTDTQSCFVSPHSTISVDMGILVDDQAEQYVGNPGFRVLSFLFLPAI